MSSVVQNSPIAMSGIPQVGDVIGEKYIVEGVLGVGGMGVVLRARHAQLGQIVAIKVLAVGEDDSSDAVERFIREGRAAVALNSEHVVRIYDVGQTPQGAPFMVMELLRGRDLASLLIERGPFSVACALEYVAQAAMAIAEAHDAGIVHRDIKPSNLFLAERSFGAPWIKVLDFGISKQLSMLPAHALRGDLTTTRQVMGSPSYMAPEQVRDARSVDQRTDVWALGATLYELITQHRAFEADTFPAVCAAIVADPPKPLATHRSDVPTAVEAIVMRCLEKTPKLRYADARSLVSAIREVQGREESWSSHLDGGLPRVGSGTIKIAAEDVARETNLASEERSGSRPSQFARDGQVREGTMLSCKLSLREQSLEDLAAAGADEPREIYSTEDRSKRWRLRGVFVLVFAVTVFAIYRMVANSGPAAFVAARDYELRVESQPEGATVFEGDRIWGNTPLVLRLKDEPKAGRGHRFQLRKPGYAEATLSIDRLSSDKHVDVHLSALSSDPNELSIRSDLLQSPLPQKDVGQSNVPRDVKRNVSRKAPREAVRVPHQELPTSSSPTDDIRTTR